MEQKKELIQRYKVTLSVSIDKDQIKNKTATDIIKTFQGITTISLKEEIERKNFIIKFALNKSQNIKNFIYKIVQSIKGIPGIHIKTVGKVEKID